MPTLLWAYIKMSPSLYNSLRLDRNRYKNTDSLMIYLLYQEILMVGLCYFNHEIKTFRNKYMLTNT